MNEMHRVVTESCETGTDLQKQHIFWYFSLWWQTTPPKCASVFCSMLCVVGMSVLHHPLTIKIKEHETYDTTTICGMLFVCCMCFLCRVNVCKRAGCCVWVMNTSCMCVLLELLHVFPSSQNYTQVQSCVNGRWNIVLYIFSTTILIRKQMTDTLMYNHKNPKNTVSSHQLRVI
jgi:hypothetical protein